MTEEALHRHVVDLYASNQTKPTTDQLNGFGRLTDSGPLLDVVSADDDVFPEVQSKNGNSSTNGVENHHVPSPSDSSDQNMVAAKPSSPVSQNYIEKPVVVQETKKLAGNSYTHANGFQSSTATVVPPADAKAVTVTPMT